ncbi:MAG: hypothetical protein JO368_08155 [Acidimicrobiales bacterium]|nr:hypothetical protein [Acidimicrobiales bacterium]
MIPNPAEVHEGIALQGAISCPDPGSVSSELTRGFERPSPESRHRRFLTAFRHLDEKIVRYYLTTVDHDGQRR